MIFVVVWLETQMCPLLFQRDTYCDSKAQFYNQFIKMLLNHINNLILGFFDSVVIEATVSAYTVVASIVEDTTKW